MTVVELMVSVVLGLAIALAAAALFLSTKSVYIAQEESEVIEDTGRHALEVIARAIRQTAYEHLDSMEAPVVMTTGMSASIAGLDNHRPGSKTPWIDASPAGKKPINGSDVLAVRLFGAGSHGEGEMLNCAGAGIPAPVIQNDAETGHGWSIFYVGIETGKPSLYCKYFGEREWAAQAIAQGIESFQVLYGIDTNADGLPNQYLNATAISKLDNALVLDGKTDADKTIDKNRKTYWKRVVSVKVALLVAGSGNITAGSTGLHYDLFGEEYSAAFAESDAGVRIGSLQAGGRVGKIFMITIPLRNHAAGSAT